MEEPLAVVAARIAMNDRVLQVLSGRPRRPGDRDPAGADFASILASLSRSGELLALDQPVAPAPMLGRSRPVEPAPIDTHSWLNGRLAAPALVPIGVGHHRLQPAAAEAFDRMRRAAIAEGIDIGVTDSYRDLDRQHELAESLGLYSEGGLAAVPGTSNHGWGIAVDLDVDGAGLAWLRANAGRFGFVEDVPREPWHWTYRP